MNKEQFKGKWEILKEKIKVQWAKLTDNEVEEIDGNVDILVGKLQEFYGITQEEAISEVDQWFNLM